jgi:hypothetical protein
MLRPKVFTDLLTDIYAMIKKQYTVRQRFRRVYHVQGFIQAFWTTAVFPEEVEF